MNLVEIPGPRGRKRFVTQEAHQRMLIRNELPLEFKAINWPDIDRHIEAVFGEGFVADRAFGGEPIEFQAIPMYRFPAKT